MRSCKDTVNTVTMLSKRSTRASWYCLNHCVIEVCVIRSGCITTIDGFTASKVSRMCTTAKKAVVSTPSDHASTTDDHCGSLY